MRQTRQETDMGMNPVDLNAVDAVAATATENAGQADQMWSNLQQGFLNSGSYSRTGNFAQGALAGRVAPVASIGSASRTAP